MASPQEIRQKNIDLIHEIIGNGYSVIVVTFNQPYEVLRKSYEKNGIALDRIYVIDTVTRYALGRDPGTVNHCRFVANPGNLTDIGIAVTEMLKVVEGERICLLFDSVNAMLVYISSQNITRFIHFVTNKLRLLNFSGIFLAMEKGLDPDVFTQLTTFVDQVVDSDAPPPPVS
jgi:KaiC/GvpD/RAD55 family RecA-like ATPase